MAADLSQALRSLARDPDETLVRNYEIQVEGQTRIKRMRLAPFPFNGRMMLVLTQEDVTDAQQAAGDVDALSRRLLDIQEEERQRIAMELHDSTGQHLVATSLALTSLAAIQEMDGAPLTPRATEVLADAATSTGEAQKEIRLLSYLLHPPNLQTDGLVASLKQFVTGFSRRSSLTCAVHLKGRLEDIDFDLQRTFFRVLQEALINVHRHAQASAVDVTLARARAMLVLEVRDNGHGMAGPKSDGQPGAALGVGISGMRARLQRLGGALDIIDSPTGVTIRAAAPLNAKLKVSRGSSARRSGPGRRSSTPPASASPQNGGSPRS